MSADHRDERSYPEREPILVGEAPENDSEQIGSQTRLSTADIAGAGERGEHGPAQIEAQVARVGTQTGTSRGSSAEGRCTPLFSAEETKEFRSRWDAIQVGFVDEPRHAVEEADGLVAATVKRLAEIFADERKSLEHQWSRGDQVSTEDLRLTLQRYRSFFGRLLSV